MAKLVERESEEFKGLFLSSFYKFILNSKHEGNICFLEKLINEGIFDLISILLKEQTVLITLNALDVIEEIFKIHLDVK
jgi:hypothetical protein